MKILAYSYREDETLFFNEFGRKYNVEIKLCKDAPSIENVSLAKGYECISIITTIIDKKLLKKLYDAGVRFISTRTIGYDHIDTEAAKELGIMIDNVTYSPSSVAEYTIMLMLMTLRKIKAIDNRFIGQDFSLNKIRGKELRNQTVGIIGTGKIGQTLIRHLSGFGCKMLAFDLYENDGVKKYAEYVTLEWLLKNSDIITLHAPATADNYHMINGKSISIMKDGVFIINTARGSLIDTSALIDAIINKKIKGAALDVIEHEPGLYYNDLKCEVINNKDLAILKSFPNVIITPHTAFYTDQAVSDMVENSIKSCVSFMKKS